MTSYLYHFYEDINGNDPLLNNRKPILFSIASLRRFRPQDRIFVVDSGLIPQNWAPYQQEFDFKVIQSQSEPILVGHPLANGRSMERLWNVTDHTEVVGDVIVSVPNDLIFIVDPEPFGGLVDAVMGGERDGMFAYRRSSERGSWMMRKWQALCLAFLRNGDFQREVMKFNLGRQVNESIILSYYLSREIPDGWGAFCFGHNMQIFHLTMPWHIPDVRSIYLNESFVGFDKIKVILSFKELYDTVSRASWMNRFLTRPVFELKDLAFQLENVQNIMAQGPNFFQEYNRNVLWEPNFYQVRKSGRKEQEF